MFNFKWQEETVGKQMVAVVAPRQAGKTHAAIEWAKEAGGKVLFVVSSHASVAPTIHKFYHMYRNEVAMVHSSHGRIIFNDNTEIQVVSGSNERMFTGVRADAVVLDNADYLSENSFLLAVSRCTGRKIFVGCTSPNRKAAKLIERFQGLHKIIVHDTDAKNISYKWLLESAY